MTHDEFTSALDALTKEQAVALIDKLFVRREDAAIVHAFGASALGVSDEFAECLLHHIGMSTDSWLSEKAIALIMWERTMAISARHEEKALSAVKYYNSVLKSFDFDSESPPVVHAFTWRARAAREAIEWVEWAHMCRQYLKARGWEPLP